MAQIVYKAVMETEVKFVGVDLQEACRMIALTSSEQECRLGPLKRVLPVRRYNNGTRPERHHQRGEEDDNSHGGPEVGTRHI